MKRFISVLISAIFALSISTAVLAHEGHKAEHNHPYPKGKFSVSKGKEIYESRCAVCHGIKGDGNGPAAAALNPKPTNFLDLKYLPMKSRVDHYEAVSDGRAGTAMSPWKNILTEKQIWDVIAYLEHLFNHQWDEGKDTSKEHSH